jgi:Ca2+-binding RTX toxin-like protein
MATAQELSINTSASAMDMAEAIFGSGVTVVDASYSGSAVSSGTYSGATTTIAGISSTDSGVILSTGNVGDFTNSSGTTDTNTATNAGSDVTGGVDGDSGLNSVAGAATYDGAILTADFIPDGDMITMSFVFSSEEYPEYVNAGYNDAFGVWVNGVYVPVTISTSGQVSIDSVNPNSNENLYRSNATDTYNTEMDGFTVVVSFKAPVNSGQVNTIKIGIADAGDAVYDSNLLIMGDSIQTYTLAYDDKVNIVANGTRTYDILANDDHPAGSTLTITQIAGQAISAGQTITLTSGQQVTLNADGTITVKANGVVGDENFTYTVTDGLGNTDVGYVTIHTTSTTTADGIVSGTSGNDLIDSAYLGDPDGDRVDNNDATGVQGTTGNDDLIYGGAGDDTIRSGAGNDIVDGGTGNDSIEGGAGADTLSGEEGNDQLYGGDANDSLDGGAGNDLLDGGAGNDILIGDIGDDNLSGGTGNDALYGGDGNDTLSGGTEGDTLFGGAGQDQLSGDAGADSLSGGDGNDALDGGDDNDTLLGDAGNDTLTGGAGADSLSGGADADLFYGGGGDVVIGGETGTDNDILIVAGDSTIAYGGGNDEAGTVTFNDGSTLTFSEIEHVLLQGPVDGTSGSDSMGAGYTDLNGDQIDGTDGLNDTIFGYGGNDTISAGAGDDTVYGGTGDDSVGGGAGNDLVHGEDGNDTLTGGTGDNQLYGEAGNDLFVADGANGAGLDTMYGGTGNDTFQIASSGGTVSVTGGENAGDNDVLALVSQDGSGAQVNWSGDESGSFGFQGGAGGTFAEIEAVEGSDGDDVFNAGNTTGGVTVTANGGHDFFTGGTGNDLFSGGDGTDEAFAGGGDDTLYGGADNDFLYGGDGNDSLEGGTGNDYMQGDAGNDLLQGNEGDDFLRGDAGNDFVYGGDGNDSVYGGADSDHVYGGDGNDEIYGGYGTDTVYGGIGNDTMTGSGGDDEVHGDEGDDVLRGSDGNDTIYGGDGADTLLGEEDADDLYAGPGDYVDGGEGVLTGTDNDTLYVTDVDHIVFDVLNPENGFVHFNDGSTMPFFNIENVIADGEQVFPPNYVVDGTAGDDLIDASYTDDPEGDMIDASDNYTGTNDDVVLAGAGNDTVLAGDGNDLVMGGEGDDSINGGVGNDTLNGEGGNDTLHGLDGDDVLSGGAGNDSLFGWAGNDSLSGGEGADMVDGDEGDDSLAGDAGNDTLVGDSGNDSLDAGAGNDQLYGGADNDLLTGGEGNDLAYGGDGDDTLIGDSAGMDSLPTSGVFSFGLYAINSGGMPINNWVAYVNGTSTFNGSADVTTVSVTDDESAFEDYGSGGGSPVDGGSAQVLTAPVTITKIVSYDAGNNPVYGEVTFPAGTPIFAVAQSDISNLTTGETGNAWVIQIGYDNTNIFYGYDIAVHDGDQLSWVSDNGGAQTPIYADVTGLEYSDLILANGEPASYDDTLYGGTGNDLISGNLGDDRLNGEDGNDTIDGGSGNDSLDGGLGNDSLSGGDGEDTVYAGWGDDTVYGGAGNDYLFADEGNDEVYGGAGNDTILTGPGDDTIYGGDGDDLVWGHGDNDLVHGDAGNDTLEGHDGDDSLYGGADNDALYGGTGNDLLEGGDGADYMQGGDDRDTFFGGAGDVVDGGEGGDDFDVLDLTAYGHPATNIIYDPSNHENGTVQFLDADGNVTGTMTFQNIEQVIACFTPGTLILTADGEKPIEEIAEDDLVLTRDNGFQPVRWVAHRDLSQADLMAEPRFNPVRFAPGSLGEGLPRKEMMVSPQHRMLVSGPRAELLFGEHEVLVAATHMVGMTGVERVMPQTVRYIHILFDQHEIVLANGAWSESFQPGEATLDGLGAEQRAEVLALFPNLDQSGSYPAARTTLRSREARVLLSA